MRRAAKVDTTHGEVMDALRKTAIAAWSTAQLGAGFPDILACPSWNPKVMVLLEVKTPGKGLNAAQVAFREKWPGLVFTVESGEEAVEAVVEAARK